jgi:hypothetical protein
MFGVRARPGGSPNEPSKRDEAVERRADLASFEDQDGQRLRRVREVKEDHRQ